MFTCEAAFREHSKKHGQREAIEYIADVNRYTVLHMPSGGSGKKPAKPSLVWLRTIFDRNEHFIEMSNMGEEDRSLELLLAILLLSAPALAVLFLFWDCYILAVGSYMLMQFASSVPQYLLCLYFGHRLSHQRTLHISVLATVSTAPRARYMPYARSDMGGTSSLTGIASRHT